MAASQRCPAPRRRFMMLRMTALAHAEGARGLVVRVAASETTDRQMPHCALPAGQDRANLTPRLDAVSTGAGVSGS